MSFVTFLASIFCSIICAVPSVAATQAQDPPSGVDVPIFVYHLVRPILPTDSTSTREYSVTPEMFDSEMEYLHDNGYNVITFADLENNLDNGTPLPVRPVIISLDDANEDQYTNAFPELEKYHFVATFFIPTDYVGTFNHLTWTQIKTMYAAGMIIGAHSKSHPDLTTINDLLTLWSEIDGSKQIIQNEIGTTTNEFAYPYGAYDPLVIELVQAAGYKSARGFSEGVYHTQSSLYSLTTVKAPDDLADFEHYLPTR